MNYSHTENIVIVTETDASHPPKPIRWAIAGTREVLADGRTARQHDYQRPMPCHRDGTRIV